MSAAAPPATAPAAARTPWSDRGTLLTGAALLLVAALAWVGVVWQSVGMDMGMPAGQATPADALLFTAMWGVMMAGMMLPSALPMVALYALVSRGQRAVPVWLFAAAYVAVWLLVGVPVYLASVGVAAVAETGGAGWLPYALAAVLVAAGAYQFSAVKRVCLKNCQGPLGFLMERFRSGYAATLRLGLAHAAYCVGCCWGLMAILVAAGAMSLPWVLLIAAAVFAEKVLPRGEWTARGVGAVLIALGAAVALNPELAMVLRGVPIGSDPMPRTPMPGMNM